MRNLAALTSKELKSFWYSPIAYVVGTFFLLAQGQVYWLLLLVLNDPRVDPGWRISQIFFGGTFFFWLTMLIIPPLMTMRAFSEEKRTGTIEVLLTAPVRDLEIILAKFLGAWLSYAALWAMSLVYFLILQRHTSIDWGPIFGGFLYTLLLGGVFLSIGVWASSLTRNQVIAAVVSFVAVLLLFMIGTNNIFVTDPNARKLIEYFSLLDHGRDFSRGIIDSRPIILYLSLIATALFLTTRSLASPRWRV
ncbi:MAG: ABC transporter permease subunit [Candidatus Omnitrophica bacterium]|nr:ABC transporter permease subunit [Candidatus Omnitrophota bacterium]